MTASVGDPVTTTGAGPQPLAAPPALRRRPVHLVGGLLAVALGSVLGAWLFSGFGHTESVVAMRQDVARGAVITAADLMTIDLRPDAALRLVPATSRDDVVGTHAAVDLRAGGLLVQDSFTTDLLPAAGQSLVGLWLSPGQLPGAALQSGDPVRVLNTPRAQDDAPRARPSTTSATVISTETSPDGRVLLTVSVPTASAAPLGALAATERIAVVLDSVAR